MYPVSRAEERAAVLMRDVFQTASWDEPTTIPALYHSCRFLQTVNDLAAANGELKSMARPRIENSLKLVRDLFLTRPGAFRYSELGARS